MRASTCATTCATRRCRRRATCGSLKRLAGRILSQEFDRGKPLWEYWFVDGLEGDRFARDLEDAPLHGRRPLGPRHGEPARRPRPRLRAAGADRRGCLDRRRAPPSSSLDELRHRDHARRSRLLGGGGGEGAPGTAPAAASRAGFRSLLGSAAGALAGGARTPLNVEIGPHRRFDWTRLPLDEVRAIGARASGTRERRGARDRQRRPSHASSSGAGSRSTTSTSGPSFR